MNTETKTRKIQITNDPVELDGRIERQSDTMGIGGYHLQGLFPFPEAVEGKRYLILLFQKDEGGNPINTQTKTLRISITTNPDSFSTKIKRQSDLLAEGEHILRASSVLKKDLLLVYQK